MSDSTYDSAKSYKRVCFREDRDLLHTELNEMQDTLLSDQKAIMDKVLTPGTILSGLDATVNGSSVTLTDGVVYIDGCAVMVPGATLTFVGSGAHTVFVDVFRRDVTAADDTSLINPLTGEPTAEREKWVATLHARDTSSDPLPTGAKGRTVVPVLVFNKDTGTVDPATGAAGDGGSIFSDFVAHAGYGGLDRHPAATTALAGFMTPDQVSTIASHGTRIQTAETSLASVSSDVTRHKTSSDHDSRYYTESEADARFASVSHIGSGGASHAAVTTSQNGFMSAADKSRLEGHESRLGSVESTLPGKADHAEVAAVTGALSTHKTSSDHDGRYYTEAESDGRFAAIAHVGAGGSAHASATASQSGFIPKEIYEFLARLTYWMGRYDYGNDGAAAASYTVISGRDGMVWKGRCDASSMHKMTAVLRSVSSAITAEFELYHAVGTVTLQTGSRVRLADTGTYPATIPGGKIYLVDLYPDSFTSITIQVSGTGDVGFALRIYPGDDRQICFDVDPARTGKAVVV